MLVLGLQGSPRAKNSNSRHLLETFLEAARRTGAVTRLLDVPRMHIEPCKEYITCEKKGFCPIQDDMRATVYPLLRQAEVVVAATPIFFFNASAQLKGLIDRCQMFWARKYRFHLADPAKEVRRGVLLAVGGSNAPRLFDGLELTVRYFFDAIDARFDGRLTYAKIEHAGEMARHPGVTEDVRRLVNQVVTPLAARPRIVFAGPHNALATQMAAAYAQHLGGERIEAVGAGSRPAERIDPAMARCMAEEGLDMAHRQPLSLAAVLDERRPARIVRCGPVAADEWPHDVPTEAWDLSRPSDPTDYPGLRDMVKQRVLELLDGLTLPIHPSPPTE